MILYRGTWSPEERAAPREYPCVYFTPDFSDAVNYAAGEKSGHNRGEGYVQRYRLPKQKILDRQTKEARDLALEFEPGEFFEDWHLMLFWDPPGKWIDFVEKRGYTGMKTGWDICIFNADKAVLTGRWHVSDVEYRQGRLRWKEEQVA